MLCKDSASSSPFMAPVAEHLTRTEQRRPPAPQKFDTARNLGQCVISCSYIFYLVPISKSIGQSETDEVLRVCDALLISLIKISLRFGYSHVTYGDQFELLRLKTKACIDSLIFFYLEYER